MVVGGVEVLARVPNFYFLSNVTNHFVMIIESNFYLFETIFKYFGSLLNQCL